MAAAVWLLAFVGIVLCASPSLSVNTDVTLTEVKIHSVDAGRLYQGKRIQVLSSFSINNLGPSVIPRGTPSSPNFALKLAGSALNQLENVIEENRVNLEADFTRDPKIQSAVQAAVGVGESLVFEDVVFSFEISRESCDTVAYLCLSVELPSGTHADPLPGNNDVCVEIGGSSLVEKECNDRWMTNSIDVSVPRMLVPNGVLRLDDVNSLQVWGVFDLKGSVTLDLRNVSFHGYITTDNTQVVADRGNSYMVKFTFETTSRVLATGRHVIDLISRDLTLNISETDVTYSLCGSDDTYLRLTADYKLFGLRDVTFDLGPKQTKIYPDVDTTLTFDLTIENNSPRDLPATFPGNEHFRLDVAMVALMNDGRLVGGDVSVIKDLILPNEAYDAIPAGTALHLTGVEATIDGGVLTSGYVYTMGSRPTHMQIVVSPTDGSEESVFTRGNNLVKVPISYGDVAKGNQMDLAGESVTFSTERIVCGQEPLDITAAVSVTVGSYLSTAVRATDYTATLYWSLDRVWDPLDEQVQDRASKGIRFEGRGSSTNPGQTQTHTIRARGVVLHRPAQTSWYCGTVFAILYVDSGSRFTEPLEYNNFLVSRVTLLCNAEDDLYGLTNFRLETGNAKLWPGAETAVTVSATLACTRRSCALPLSDQSHTNYELTLAMAQDGQGTNSVDVMTINGAFVATATGEVRPSLQHGFNQSSWVDLVVTGRFTVPMDCERRTYVTLAVSPGTAAGLPVDGYPENDRNVVQLGNVEEYCSQGQIDQIDVKITEFSVSTDDKLIIDQPTPFVLRGEITVQGVATVTPSDLPIFDFRFYLSHDAELDVTSDPEVVYDYTAQQMAVMTRQYETGSHSFALSDVLRVDNGTYAEFYGAGPTYLGVRLDAFDPDPTNDVIGAIDESSETNNDLIIPIFVHHPKDFAVMAFSIELDPRSPLEKLYENTPTTLIIDVSLQNLGEELPPDDITFKILLNTQNSLEGAFDTGAEMYYGTQQAKLRGAVPAFPYTLNVIGIRATFKVPIGMCPVLRYVCITHAIGEIAVYGDTNSENDFSCIDVTAGNVKKDCTKGLTLTDLTISPGQLFANQDTDMTFDLLLSNTGARVPAITSMRRTLFDLRLYVNVEPSLRNAVVMETVLWNFGSEEAKLRWEIAAKPGTVTMQGLTAQFRFDDAMCATYSYICVEYVPNIPDDDLADNFQCRSLISGTFQKECDLGLYISHFSYDFDPPVLYVDEDIRLTFNMSVSNRGPRIIAAGNQPQFDFSLLFSATDSADDGQPADSATFQFPPEAQALLAGDIPATPGSIDLRGVTTVFTLKPEDCRRVLYICVRISPANGSAVPPDVGITDQDRCMHVVNGEVHTRCPKGLGITALTAEFTLESVAQRILEETMTTLSINFTMSNYGGPIRARTSGRNIEFEMYLKNTDDSFNKLDTVFTYGEEETKLSGLIPPWTFEAEGNVEFYNVFIDFTVPNDACAPATALCLKYLDVNFDSFLFQTFTFPVPGLSVPSFSYSIDRSRTSLPVLYGGVDTPVTFNTTVRNDGGPPIPSDSRPNFQLQLYLAQQPALPTSPFADLTPINITYGNQEAVLTNQIAADGGHVTFTSLQAVVRIPVPACSALEYLCVAYVAMETRRIRDDDPNNDFHCQRMQKDCSFDLQVKSLSARLSPTFRFDRLVPNLDVPLVFNVTLKNNWSTIPAAPQGQTNIQFQLWSASDLEAGPSQIVTTTFTMADVYARKLSAEIYGAGTEVQFQDIRTVALLSTDTCETSGFLCIMYTRSRDMEFVDDRAENDDGCVPMTLGNIRALCDPFCQAPPAPPQGSVTLSDPTMFYQSTATYSCDSGHLLVGNGTATCLGAGVWSTGQPECQLVDCGPPNVMIAHGDLVLNSTRYQAVTRFRCHHGYRLSSDATLTCGPTKQWIGELPTCIDYDACLSSPCFPGVRCVDVPAPDTGFTCGTCPPGYSGDGLNCTDNNECESPVQNTCEQICVNTEPGFYCACPDGYRLNDDQETCMAYADCPIGHRCSHSCAMIAGKQVCSCPAGFTLVQNTTCVDIDDCATPARCRDNTTCLNLNGSFACRCDEFTVLDSDGLGCSDLDECQSPTLNTCDQVCVNSDPGFRCTCQDGFILAQDGFTCLANSTCPEDHPCSHACTLVNDTAVCACPTGMRMGPGGRRCEDIDECSEFPDICREDAVCENAVGGFRCTCPSGEPGLDGLSCGGDDENHSIQVFIIDLPINKWEGLKDSFNFAIADAVNDYCNTEEGFAECCPYSGEWRELHSYTSQGNVGMLEGYPKVETESEDVEVRIFIQNDFGPNNLCKTGSGNRVIRSLTGDQISAAKGQVLRKIRAAPEDPAQAPRYLPQFSLAVAVWDGQEDINARLGYRIRGGEGTSSAQTAEAATTLASWVITIIFFSVILTIMLLCFLAVLVMKKKNERSNQVTPAGSQDDLQAHDLAGPANPGRSSSRTRLLGSQGSLESGESGQSSMEMNESGASDAYDEDSRASGKENLTPQERARLDRKELREHERNQIFAKYSSASQQSGSELQEPPAAQRSSASQRAGSAVQGRRLPPLRLDTVIREVVEEEEEEEEEDVSPRLRKRLRSAKEPARTNRDLRTSPALPGIEQYMSGNESNC
ncbi:PREDICTED: uncharacterized protein LOC109468820 [Branchiostoma belcheri]|uniref:Uncharacterized protein LOC109468820 n=1 Tax=Branchiostoma belcheri TaxID=7741 RepID=A0A6P4YE62_BRABE|nr:PREDICTED: uncharacterized protein LOC109468820 [Branchiostoma belcheri]